jgi:AcrR family transcriptional regulator
MMKDSESATRRASGRPTTEEAAKTEDRLLDAAGELFVKFGYANTTMAKISHRAGASTKTVYSRYANKAEILAAVIRRLVDRTMAAPAFEELPREDHNVRTHLAILGRRFAELAGDPTTAEINRLVIAEGVRFPELITVFREGPDRARGIVCDALERFQASGKLPQMPTAEVSAVLFFDMSTATPRMRALLGAPMSKQEIATHVDAAMSVFLNGIGSQSIDGIAGLDGRTVRSREKS